MSEKVALVVNFISAFLTGFILAYSRSWRLALAMSSILPCIGMTGAVMNKFVSKYMQWVFSPSHVTDIPSTWINTEYLSSMSRKEEPLLRRSYLLSELPRPSELRNTCPIYMTNTSKVPVQLTPRLPFGMVEDSHASSLSSTARTLSPSTLVLPWLMRDLVSLPFPRVMEVIDMQI